MSIPAAGAVLWRRAGDELQLALVHRPRYDDWSFPKGKLEPGESMPHAAVREVAEETGHAARLCGQLCDIYYEVPDGPKTVRYWSAEAGKGDFAPNEETDELRWCSPAEAAGLLSYARDVDVLDRFTAVGVPDSMVLLVRHAKAGSRNQWKCDDDLRPLSSSGQDQAKHLSELLGLFGPDRVASAPPLRCRDTVAPMSAALSLPVTDEPLLGEDGYWANSPAGLVRLRELTAVPGVTVLCSQGGVIPDVVGDLTGRTDVRARKASTWVLGFAGGVLRTVDYYPFPTG